MFKLFEQYFMGSKTEEKIPSINATDDEKTKINKEILRKINSHSEKTTYNHNYLQALTNQTQCCENEKGEKVIIHLE